MTPPQELITNFDLSKIPLYREALARYPRAVEYQLYVKDTGWNNFPDTGSLWCYNPNCRDLSDFWDIYRVVEAEFQLYQRLRVSLPKMHNLQPRHGR
jgi:hypothetical protein